MPVHDDCGKMGVDHGQDVWLRCVDCFSLIFLHFFPGQPDVCGVSLENVPLANVPILTFWWMKGSSILSMPMRRDTWPTGHQSG